MSLPVELGPAFRDSEIVGAVYDRPNQILTEMDRAGVLVL